MKVDIPHYRYSWKYGTASWVWGGSWKAARVRMKRGVERIGQYGIEPPAPRYPIFLGPKRGIDSPEWERGFCQEVERLQRLDLSLRGSRVP